MVTSAQGCECKAVWVSRDANCVDVADEMDVNTVGCVVVVEDGAPVGMITDRDLVCRVVARDRDPAKTRADEIMTTDVVTSHRTEDLESVLRAMKEHSIRRMPIVENGKLVGIVTLDDVLVQLGSYIFNANRGILGGIQESHRTTPHRRRTEAREEAIEEIWRQLNILGEQAQKSVRDRVTELFERFDSRK